MLGTIIGPRSKALHSHSTSGIFCGVVWSVFVGQQLTLLMFQLLLAPLALGYSPCCFCVFVRLQIIGNAFAFPQYEASDFGDASQGGRGQNQVIFHLGTILHLPSAVLVTPRSHTRPHPHQNPHPSHTKTLQPSAAHQAQPAVLFYLRRFNKRRPAWRVLFKRNGVG